MKMKRNFAVLLTAVIVLVFMGTVAWADPKPKPPAVSSLIGTWMGHASGDMIWLAVHTPGRNADENGDMVMNWVYVSQSLLGNAARLTPGHGVWKKIGEGQYAFTWYAYGIGPEGYAVSSVRVSGLAANTDGDHVNINYKFEVFGVVTPQEMSSLAPTQTITGSAEEWRTPLVTP